MRFRLALVALLLACDPQPSQRQVKHFRQFKLYDFGGSGYTVEVFRDPDAPVTCWKYVSSLSCLYDPEGALYRRAAKPSAEVQP